MTQRQQEEAIELLSRIAQEHRLTQGAMTRITGLLARIAQTPEKMYMDAPDDWHD